MFEYVEPVTLLDLLARSLKSVPADHVCVLEGLSMHIFDQPLCAVARLQSARAIQRDIKRECARQFV